MLWAPTQRLHRRPHITTRFQQIPTGLDKLLRRDPSALVHLLRRALGRDVFQRIAPCSVAIALDHRVGSAAFKGFLREQRCVYAAVHNPSASRTSLLAQLIAAQRIAGMNADSDYIALLNDVRIKA